MRCHHHLQVEAIAICVGCGRGVCRDCQQTTAGERSLCGLPQCADFAGRQKAVQVALRQDCANNATSYQTLASLMRFISLTLLPFAVLLWTIVPWGGLFDRLATVSVACLFTALAGIFRYGAKRLRAIAQNYEDIARGFG